MGILADLGDINQLWQNRQVGSASRSGSDMMNCPTRHNKISAGIAAPEFPQAIIGDLFFLRLMTQSDGVFRRGTELEAGVEHLLRLQGHLAPGRVRFARQRQFGETAEHVGFLGVVAALLYFAHRETPRVVFHVEVASRECETGLDTSNATSAPYQGSTKSGT